MFKNEPLTDFSITSNRDAFELALISVARNLPIVAMPIINGESISTSEHFERYSPNNTSKLVSKISFADLQHAEDALTILKNYSSTWSKTAATERCDIIRKAATLMQKRRHEISALMVFEAGKPWKEADADTAEAIDFCLYYADEMEKLSVQQKTATIPGEDNVYFYKPRGVAVVISPWNFPFAIACGMTVASLVTGNCTVLKPAEQTSAVGALLASILLEAGVPKEAFAFLPGRGEIIGKALVESVNVDLICFTGSRAVGLEIVKNAAIVHPKQKSIKKVIAELGGKNAIIVDNDADPDEAIKGIIYSAFGYAGQKCSACSRLIVVEPMYENILSRLSDAIKDLIVGDASISNTLVGPVIDKEAYERILATLRDAKERHKLLAEGESVNGGYYIPPTAFRDVSEDSALWQEEVFGPVLACQRAASFEQAVAMANESDYALTGAVFSRNPSNLSYARQNFLVGNLYLNRGSTGALVCRQPFGGFKMSGVGSKAGGPDYLLQFMEPRVVTENTMRRGFVPETK